MQNEKCEHNGNIYNLKLLLERGTQMLGPDKVKIVASNGWHEYAKFVLNELERLGDCYVTMTEQRKLDYEKASEERANIRIAIAKLQVKAGVWGLIAGLIPSAIAVFWIISSRGGS